MNTAKDYEKYRNKIEYMKEYRTALNAATASKRDPNANVEHKNIVTAAGEMMKEDSIGVNRLLMCDKLLELYGKEWPDMYLKDIESHLLYKHDETSLFPYCVSITMYPFLFEGTESIGGSSKAPKHLDSFCGEFINLVFNIAAQFAGAVSTPEFLMYFDYFLRKEYGDQYYLNSNLVVTSPIVLREQTIEDVINAKLQQIVYSINEPAAARNYQAVFWNIASFDEPYFKGLFDGFVFPDGTTPIWESLDWLQRHFMNWFNNERCKKILTFPVETMNLLNNNSEYVYKPYFEFTAEMYSKGHSFFTYTSNSVDSLASCCRLKNELVDNTFSYTLGAGGVSTGSKGVMTININRLVQDATKSGKDISQAVKDVVERVHKYLIAYNEIKKDDFASGLLPAYDAGYITLEKQFLTVGINGFVEGAESLGIEPTTNEEYFEYGEKILKPIYELNKRDRTKEIMFNTEFVPKMCGHKAA